MNEKKQIKSLAQTEFYSSLLQKAATLIPRDKKRTVTPLEKYQRAVLDICLDVDGLFEMLELSITFIGQMYPRLKKVRIEVTPGKFLRYHIECYYIRITTLEDLFYKLLNRVYDLNLNENSRLKWKLLDIAKKEKIAFIEFIVNAIDVALQKIREIRNSIAHGQSYSFSHLAMIQGEDVMMSYSSTNEQIEPMKNDIYNDLIKSTVMYHLIIIRNNTEELKTFLIYSFEKLHEVRLTKENKLSNSHQ